MNAEHLPQPTDRAPVVDAATLRRVREALRATSQPAPCWWCRRPLTGPTCPTCDAEGVA